MEVMELPAPGAALRLERRPEPKPGAGEVRLRVEACAVCRTDLQICDGDLEARGRPIVPGHQVVGRVEAVGSRVRPGLMGRRLGVGWLASACGRCRFCRGGRENLCPAATFTGWDRDGGFASQLLVRADFAQPLPDQGDPALMAPLLCGGVIGYRAWRCSLVGRGDRLGLYGFGASAHLVAQVALAEGCRLFVVTRNPAAQRLAQEMGATWVGPPGRRLPRQLQAAITFTPQGSAVMDALRALDRGGRCVVNAIHLDRIPGFEYQLLYWERQLLSVANFTRQDASDFLRMADEIPVRPRIQRFSLADANSALGRLREGSAGGVGVLIP